MNVSTSPQKSNWIKSLFENLLLVLFCLVLSLCVLEWGVRHFRLVNRLHNRVSNAFHDNIGYLHKPHQKTAFRYEGKKIAYETNNLGFRDLDRAIPKPPGTYRVLFLGDSFLESPWLEREQIFPALLEKKFQAEGKKAEFVNFGVLGFGTTVEFELMKAIGMKVQPDFVAVAFYMNDILDNYYPPLERGKPAAGYAGPVDNHLVHITKDENGNWLTIQPERYPSRGSLRVFINEHFHLYQFLGDGFPAFKHLVKRFDRDDAQAPQISGPVRPEGNALQPVQMANFLNSAPKEIELGWERTAYTLKQMRDYLGAQGIRMMVVYLPPDYLMTRGAWEAEMKRFDLDPAAGDMEKPRVRLNALCKSLGIDLVDPTEQFQNAGISLHLKGDPHFNPQGHSLMAEALTPYFEKILPQKEIKTS